MGANADAGPDAADAVVVTSGLTVRALGTEVLPGETGTWRVEVKSLGQVIAEAPLAADAQGRPTARFGGLTPGEYDVTVWLDRDGNGTLNGCPFPPQLKDAARPDAYENLVGMSKEVLGRGLERTLEIAVDRRTCGPGDAATGLSGTLDLPAALGGPLLLHLAPSARCDGTLRTDIPALTVGLPAVPEGGRRDFSLGELLPGCFDLSFFADADADGLPTACTAVPGGGDRAVVRVLGFQLPAESRVALEADVRLVNAARCPSTLLGLHGTVSFGDALQAALAGGEVGIDVLAAPARISLTYLPTGDHQDWALPFAQVPATGSVPFTLTGLTPGPWDMTVYLDGDADRIFTPCGGLNGGVDAIFEQRLSLDVQPDGLTELGDVRLQRSAACAETGTELRLRPEIELEDGPVGSGRPLRLELVPVDAAGERRSVLLFENHRALDARPTGADGAWHMAIQAHPGTYQARIFVDTNRDGVFSSCEQDPFADRGTAEPVTVAVTGDGTLDFQDVVVRRLDCPVPDVAIGPTFVPPVDLPAPAGQFLRFEIAEAGGWMQSYPLRQPVGSEALPYEQAPIKLAPGNFELRAWLDGRADGAYDGCDGLRPEALTGHVLFTLDARTTATRPEVLLSPPCP